MQAKSVVGLSGILLMASAEMLSVAPSRLPQLTTLAQSASAVAPPLEGAQQAVLNKYCTGCHNDKVKTGGFSLAGADVANVAGNSDLWENVLRKLEGRQMPPIGRPRPDEATYDSLASHLEPSLDRIAAANPNPGRTETFRRLTRTEYRNAVRDLLAVDVEVESLLPPDDSSFGFDNVTVGNLSPTLMEKYLASAQKISRLAVGTSVRTPIPTSSRCRSTRRRSSISATFRWARVAARSSRIPSRLMGPMNFRYVSTGIATSMSRVLDVRDEVRIRSLSSTNSS